jgi:1,4-alpha-glucan branching enzyme
MLFMGQEFLEEKGWSSDPGSHPETLIYWSGLETQDKYMVDHLRFTQDAVQLRASYPALRGDDVHAYFFSDKDRVLAFHRWLEDPGQDVIVVATMSDTTWWGYEIAFPSGGYWKEVFNSDVYDNWVNPNVAGNGGGIGVPSVSASAKLLLSLGHEHIDIDGTRALRAPPCGLNRTARAVRRAGRAQTLPDLYRVNY